MELIIITIVACGLLIVGALGIYLFSKDKKEKVDPLKNAYHNALQSGDKKLALEAGRNYYRALRNGRLTIYDEQAITNDLNAME